MAKEFKHIALILFMVLLLNLLIGDKLLFFLKNTTAPEKIKFSEAIVKVEKEEVASGSITSKGTFDFVAKNGDKYTTVLPNEDKARSDFQDILGKHNVKFEIKKPPVSQVVLSTALSFLLPLGLLVIMWIMFMRHAAGGGGNQALNFGRSRAQKVGENMPKVTFKDVAGVDEAKQELEEVIEFLRDPKKFQALGAKIPKGVLLLGPPGCGKTLLARAVAGEAGVAFFHISGSDFVEMFVGVGASRVRDLFEMAKANRPSLVFIDEIDAVGRQRGAGLGGGNDEREQTLNQLLVEMDGFDANSGVILIAATNRPDVLDPALLRPGRFDRRVTVDQPDANGREAILKVHLKGKPLDESVDAKELAKRTPGFSGADLANLVNEGALLAARRNRTKILMSDLNDSIEKVIAGPERKSRLMNEKEKEMVAYHELGHAIVSELIEDADPVHKISILPRGMALGYTMQMPMEDKYLATKNELLARVAGLLGGRVAEELVFNESSTGASNDLERATELVRAMVCEYGMSSKIGPLTVGKRHTNPFLGRDYMEDRNYSEEMATAIDSEIRSMVEEAYNKAKDILTANRDKLERIVKVLLERETIERDEFLALLAGEELPPKVEPEDDTPITKPDDAKDETPETVPNPQLETNMAFTKE